jgi:hypothetical protein
VKSSEKVGVLSLLFAAVATLVTFGRGSVLASVLASVRAFAVVLFLLMPGVAGLGLGVEVLGRVSAPNSDVRRDRSKASAYIVSQIRKETDERASFDVCEPLRCLGAYAMLTGNIRNIPRSNLNTSYIGTLLL